MDDEGEALDRGSRDSSAFLWYKLDDGKALTNLNTKTLFIVYDVFI